jgi:hypothetical protein
MGFSTALYSKSFLSVDSVDTIYNKEFSFMTVMWKKEKLIQIVQEKISP